MDGYVFWKFHGEREFPFVPKQLPTKETVGAKSDPISRLRLNELIDDAFGFHVLQTDHTPDVVDCDMDNTMKDVLWLMLVTE